MQEFKDKEKKWNKDKSFFSTIYLTLVTKILISIS